MSELPIGMSTKRSAAASSASTPLSAPLIGAAGTRMSNSPAGGVPLVDQNSASWNQSRYGSGSCKSFAPLGTTMLERLKRTVKTESATPRKWLKNNCQRVELACPCEESEQGYRK
jgi:hypothetical protein